MFALGLNPYDVSICCSAAGESRLCVRSRSACRGLPGMKRGMKKFSVSAAQRVSMKKPRRRKRYLILTLLSRLALLLSRLGVDVGQKLPDVGHVERGRLAVRVLRCR